MDVFWMRSSSHHWNCPPNPDVVQEITLKVISKYTEIIDPINCQMFWVIITIRTYKRLISFLFDKMIEGWILVAWASNCLGLSGELQIFSPNRDQIFNSFSYSCWPELWNGAAGISLLWSQISLTPSHNVCCPQCQIDFVHLAQGVLNKGLLT